MVVVAGNENVCIRDGLPAHNLPTPPFLKFGGGMAGCTGFMAVSESDRNASDLEDKIVTVRQDCRDGVVTVRIDGEDFSNLFDDCEVVVVGGASEGFTVQPVLSVVAWYSRENDARDFAGEVVDGSEDESTG